MHSNQSKHWLNVLSDHMLLYTESHFMWPFFPHYRSWTLRRFLLGISELKNVYLLPASWKHFDCFMLTWFLSLGVGKHMAVTDLGRKCIELMASPFLKGPLLLSSCTFGWYFVSTTHKITQLISSTPFHFKDNKVYDPNCFNLIWSGDSSVCARGIQTINLNRISFRLFTLSAEEKGRHTIRVLLKNTFLTHYSLYLLTNNV